MTLGTSIFLSLIVCLSYIFYREHPQQFKATLKVILTIIFLVCSYMYYTESYKPGIEARREDKARPCLATEIPNIEAEVKAISDAIRNNFKGCKDAGQLTKLQTILDDLTKTKSKIDVSYNNIKNKVLSTKLYSSCDSRFYIDINILEGEYGCIYGADFSPIYSPHGYDTKNITRYNIDFISDEYGFIPDSRASR